MLGDNAGGGPGIGVEGGGVEVAVRLEALEDRGVRPEATEGLHVRAGGMMGGDWIYRRTDLTFKWF